tara:strand:+ start:53 stop:358 length:306 start_codon:yes stop_codon:yes gene_type:complete
MKKRILWTPVALKSLQEVQEFLLKHWNEEILKTFLDLIDFKISQLKENSKLGKIVIKERSYRRLVVHKNITLFYSIETDIIKILLIWDNRQDPTKLLDTLS